MKTRFWALLLLSTRFVAAADVATEKSASAPLALNLAAPQAGLALAPSILALQPLGFLAPSRETGSLGLSNAAILVPTLAPPAAEPEMTAAAAPVLSPAPEPLGIEGASGLTPMSRPDHRISLDALEARLSELRQESNPEPETVVPGQHVLPKLLDSMRAAAENPGGIADGRRASLAVAAVFSRKPVQKFRAAYSEARDAFGVEPQSAARLAVSAVVSEAGVAKLVDSYRRLQRAPYGFAPETASRLAAAAAISGGAPAEALADSYKRMLVAVEATGPQAAPEVALRLKLTAQFTEFPPNDLVFLYRRARLSLGAVGGEETAARLVVAAAVAAKENGKPLDHFLLDETVAFYVQARAEGLDYRIAADLAAAAAISDRPLKRVVMDYSKARLSKPIGIADERAAKVTLASALASCSIDELIALFQQARDPRKGNVEAEAAVRVAASAAMLVRERGGLVNLLDLLTEDHFASGD